MVMVTQPGPAGKIALLDRQRRLTAADCMLSSGEVARWLRVDPHTVQRWHKDGRLPAGRTPGGRLRFSYNGIANHLDATREPAA